MTAKGWFGGLAFMVDGNEVLREVVGGVVSGELVDLTIAAPRRGGLLVRTDPADAEDTAALPDVEPMETTGRPMPGWFFVAPEALDSEAALDLWIARALSFVATLPAK